MTGQFKPIEEFFLESLLKICLASILVVMAVDFYFTGFIATRSLIIDFVILFSVVTAWVICKLKLFIFSVIWTGFIVTSAMFYQSLSANMITTSSMAVIMVVGMGYSVLLKKRLPWVLHFLTLVGMITVFVYQSLHPLQFGKSSSGDIIVAGITYAVLYLIIVSSAWILKQRYDEALASLGSKNIELIEKSNEIETQNEELVQSQDNLHSLNLHLENLVQERTNVVQRQNEQLIKYAYTNAHHLRGPVARLLGLIQLSKMNSDLEYSFLFEKIEAQTHEIDEVVQSINRELDSGNESC